MSVRDRLSRTMREKAKRKARAMKPEPKIVEPERAVHNTPEGFVDVYKSGQWVENSEGVITFDPTAGKGKKDGRLYSPTIEVEPGTMIEFSASIRQAGTGKARLSLAAYSVPEPGTAASHTAGEIEGDSVDDDGVSRYAILAKDRFIGVTLVAMSDGENPIEFSNIQFGPKQEESTNEGA